MVGFARFDKQREGSKRGAYRRAKRRYNRAEKASQQRWFGLMTSNLLVPLNWSRSGSKHKKRKEVRRMDGHGNSSSAVQAHPGLVVNLNGWKSVKGNSGSAKGIQGDDLKDSTDR